MSRVHWGGWEGETGRLEVLNWQRDIKHGKNANLSVNDVLIKIFDSYQCTVLAQKWQNESLNRYYCYRLSWVQLPGPLRECYLSTYPHVVLHYRHDGCLADLIVIMMMGEWMNCCRRQFITREVRMVLWLVTLGEDFPLSLLLSLVENRAQI